MGGPRLSRVQEAIKEEISQIIQFELKDPRVGFVTVTSVNISPDLRQARIFLTILGNPEEQKESLAGLNSAKGFIRSELGKRIRMKFTPQIEFEIDQSIKEGIRISKLIDYLHKEEKR